MRHRVHRVRVYATEDAFPLIARATHCVRLPTIRICKYKGHHLLVECHSNPVRLSGSAKDAMSLAKCSAICRGREHDGCHRECESNKADCYLFRSRMLVTFSSMLVIIGSACFYFIAVTKQLELNLWYATPFFLMPAFGMLCTSLYEFYDRKIKRKLGLWSCRVSLILSLAATLLLFGICLLVHSYETSDESSDWHYAGAYMLGFGVIFLLLAFICNERFYSGASDSNPCPESGHLLPTSPPTDQVKRNSEAPMGFITDAVTPPTEQS